MSTYSKALKSDLARLKQAGCIAALKTGTEVEDMGPGEIAFMREISTGIMPLIVKIGGPEARNDIRTCLELGVDGILAPMVETVYALANFVKAVEQVCLEKEAALPYLAMNLESITAYENLDNMIETRAFQVLSQVTIGRGDLSASMHMGVDDQAVIDITSTALRKINGLGKVTSCGGGLKLANIGLLVKEVHSDRYNTRHMVLENSPKFQKRPAYFLYQALNFEQKMCQALGELFKEKRHFYQHRVEVLGERMGGFEIRKSI